MRNYIAFISYRHCPLDSLVAKKLHRMIERFHIPSELRQNSNQSSLGYVFRDQDELPVSSDLSANIREALDNSAYLIVVCSPETQKSIWVEREINYFLEHHDRDHILAVLVDGRPEESFPDALVNVYDINGEIVDTTEPLAANIVGIGKNRTLKNLRSESLRIIAALIGCSYDSLYQREKRYRAKRIAVIMSIFSLIVLSFFGTVLAKNNEIAKQNEDLITQKKQIQLSESQLLVNDAEAELNDGDYAAAIANALRALPQSELDDRPYYAPAERVLLSALGIYEVDRYTERAIIGETEISIDTPIRQICSTSDGAELVVLDEYGNLSAFNPISGIELWSKRAPGISDITIENAISSISVNESNETVLHVFDHMVSCYRLNDGSLLWQVTLDEPVERLLNLSHDGYRIAIVECTNTFLDVDDSFRSSFELVILDAHTGNELNRIPIANDKNYWDFQIGVAHQNEADMKNGLFIENRNQFVGFYYENDYSSISYYVADLSKNTSRVIYTEPSDYGSHVLHIETTSDGSGMAVIKDSNNPDAMAECKMINLEDGSLLWHSTAGKANDRQYSSLDIESHILKEGDYLLLSVEDHLFKFDLKTGQVVASTTLYSNLTHMSWIGEDIFGFILEDGYYALGWQGEDGFHDSQLFRYCYNMDANIESAIINGGLIIPVIHESTLSGIVLNHHTNLPGYLAFIPSGSERIIKICYLLPGIEIDEFPVTEYPFDQYSICDGSDGTYLRIQDNRATIFGRYYENGIYKALDDLDKSILSNDDPEEILSMLDEILIDVDSYPSSPEEISEVRVVGLMDTNTHRVTQLYSYNVLYGYDEHLTSDRRGVVLSDESTGHTMYLCFENNSYTTLVEENNVELYRQARTNTDGDIIYLDNEMEVSSAYRTSDHKLMTSACDGETLYIWLDGVKQEEIPIPEDIVWQVNNRLSLERVLTSAPNGCIYLSNFKEDTTGDHIAEFAAYDTTNGKWYCVKDVAKGNARRVFATGFSNPLLAILDSDNYLRYYDLVLGNLIGEIPLDMPFEYVKEMQYILDDRYIMLRMSDGQMIVFSTDTGNLVYQGKLAYGGEHTAVSIDSNEERVIILDVYNKEAIILEANTWTELARVNNVCGFDPILDEMYFYASDESFSHAQGIVAKKIPSRSELIQIGHLIISD